MAIKFQVTKIKEQGVTFDIVIIKRSILNNRHKANNIISEFENKVFGEGNKGTLLVTM